MSQRIEEVLEKGNQSQEGFLFQKSKHYKE